MRIDCSPTAAGGADAPESVARLCAQTAPYLDDTHSEAQFVEAMRDITIWHRDRSPWYDGLLRNSGVHAERMTTMADVVALPPVHANFFKQHEVLSVPESEVVLNLTSSGTTGQKSQMFFDAFTIGNARRMVDDVMRARGVVSEAPANYLVNAYEPTDGMRVGTSNTNQYLMRYAPPAKVFWSLRALGGCRTWSADSENGPQRGQFSPGLQAHSQAMGQKDGGKWTAAAHLEPAISKSDSLLRQGQHEFDAFGTLAALREYSEDSGRPTRIIGFPAFLHFALQRMQRMEMEPLQLPEGSCVIFGGGWKGHADQAISKEQLHRDITHWLGIPADRIVETFGAVEHSIPYVGCTLHHLHAPLWSRVLVRDTRTLATVPDGQPGFLSFLSPYITSVPAHSVVMGDLAVRHPGSSCACGNPMPWFEVLGRAGTSSNKSCAAAAAELLPSS